GAGKTFLSRKLFGGNHSGVLSPDKGKEAVRRSLPQATSSAAHVQGSMLALKLFPDLARMLDGTVVYDASLSQPHTVKRNLELSAAAGKRYSVKEVVRPEGARGLAVLRRTIGGADPRTPAKNFVSGAMADNLNRHACLNVILEHKTADDGPGAEYEMYA